MSALVTTLVIFIYDETNPEHKSSEKHNATNLEFGGGLGQWEDEFDGKDYIEELVIGGARSYSYKTKYGCTKKGKVITSKTKINHSGYGEWWSC